jgi:uncharacterized protein YndB with AHSA1/START domain
MSDKYERTFAVAVPVERAWRAFTNQEELEAWWAPEVREFDPRPGGRVHYAMPGFAEVEGTVEELEPERRIRWSEGPGLLPGTTDVTVTFESIATGTRVTVTHAGFGEGEEWIDELESHTLGWNEVIADLVLYLEHGVRSPRHSTSKSLVGVVTLDKAAGIEVVSVRQGSYADEVGLRPGDLLVQLGDAPLFRRSDLWLFTREHESGKEVEAVYVRGRDVLRATARLSPRTRELVESG